MIPIGKLGPCLCSSSCGTQDLLLEGVFAMTTSFLLLLLIYVPCYGIVVCEGCRDQQRITYPTSSSHALLQNRPCSRADSAATGKYSIGDTKIRTRNTQVEAFVSTKATNPPLSVSEQFPNQDRVANTRHQITIHSCIDRFVDTKRETVTAYHRRIFGAVRTVVRISPTHRIGGCS